MEQTCQQLPKPPIPNRHTTRTLRQLHQEQAQAFPKQSSHDHIKLGKIGRKYRSINCTLGNRTSLMINKKGGLDLHQFIDFGEDAKKKRDLEPKMQKLENFQDRCYQKYNVGVKKCVTFVVEKDKNAKEIPIELYIQIKQVFRYLEILKNYGFEQKKIVKWMNTFLSRKSQTICDIFLRSYQNKKSLSDSLIFQRFTTLDSIITKMQKQAEKLNETEVLYLISEIRQFKNYIEEIVIKKTQSNLCKIFNIGEVNPMLRFDQGNNLYNNSTEITHFIKDLKGIQERYGELSSISKLNRVMFKQVLIAQQKFRNEFYSNKNTI